MSNVQHAIENTNAIYQAALDFWAMTPIELKMFIAVMFTTSILMQYIKKAFLRKCTKKERIEKLWLYSFPIGAMLSVLAYYVYGDLIKYGFFMLTGFTVSTVSMGVHRVVVDYVWPAIKMVVKFSWDRLMLFIRGSGNV